MSQSYIAAPHTLAQALQELIPHIGAFTFNNETEYSPLHPKLVNALAVEFMHGKSAVGTAVPVNEFLASKGFSIRFKEPQDANTVIVAGIVDISVIWQEKVTKTKITVNNSLVPGVRFSKPQEYSNSVHPHPVFRLHTVENFEVYVSRLPEARKDNFADLQQYAQGIMDAKLEYASHYDALEFPMVNLDVKGDLPIFNHIRLQGKGGEYVTGGGKFQGILKLNEKGARAKAAAGGSVYLSCCREPKPTYTIDGPFIFWVVRDNVVYFAAHVFEDAMSVPLNLE